MAVQRNAILEELGMKLGTWQQQKLGNLAGKGCNMQRSRVAYGVGLSRAYQEHREMRLRQPLGWEEAGPTGGQRSEISEGSGACAGKIKAYLTAQRGCR